MSFLNTVLPALLQRAAAISAELGHASSLLSQISSTCAMYRVLFQRVEFLRVDAATCLSHLLSLGEDVPLTSGHQESIYAFLQPQESDLELSDCETE